MYLTILVRASKKRFTTISAGNLGAKPQYENRTSRPKIKRNTPANPNAFSFLTEDPPTLSLSPAGERDRVRGDAV
jgi:hypothetical protein